MKYSKIKSIKKIGKRQTYDIEMPEPNNFVANKFVVHNSGQTMLYVNRRKVKLLSETSRQMRQSF